MQPEPGRSPSATAPKEDVVLRRFSASAQDAGRRLDLFLASRLPELSRTRIQELIDQGRVRVDDRLPRRAHRLSAGETAAIEVLPRRKFPCSCFMKTAISWWSISRREWWCTWARAPHAAPW